MQWSRSSWSVQRFIFSLCCREQASRANAARRGGPRSDHEEMPGMPQRRTDRGTPLRILRFSTHRSGWSWWAQVSFVTGLPVTAGSGRHLFPRWRRGVARPLLSPGLFLTTGHRFPKVESGAGVPPPNFCWDVGGRLRGKPVMAAWSLLSCYERPRATAACGWRASSGGRGQGYAKE